MELIYIFMSMSFIYGSIAIGALILNKCKKYAPTAKNLAVNAASCCGIFGALALVGLLFV